MKKRLLSILLALVLVLALLPFGTFAAGSTVHVIAKNETYLTAQHGVNGIKAPAWTGTAIEVDIPYTSGMTVYQVLKKMPSVGNVAGVEITNGSYGHYVKGVYGVYDSDVARPNMDGTETTDGTYTILGGWMVLVNDWMCDTGIDSQTVAAGDVISLEYSMDYGADIGADWMNTDAKLKDLSFSAGALYPAFDPEVTDYTLYLPTDVKSVTVTPAAANRNDKATVLASGEKEARWGARSVNVKNADVTVSVTNVSYDYVTYEAITKTTEYKVALRPLSDEHVCERFTDLKNNWSRAGICYVAENGLMSGTGDGTTFAPDMPTSRAMFAAVLYRTVADPKPGKSNTFTDVPDGKWYSKAVNWAAANNVVAGVGDGTFRPDQNVTRQEAAAMLYRFVGLQEGEKITETLKDYSDAGSVARWAKEAFAWAVQKGIITGTSATTLSPLANASRAQLASILWRTFGRNDAVSNLMGYLLTGTSAPTCGNGDWLVMDFARAQAWTTPGYDDYYASVVAKAKATDGKMDAVYPTDYARIALAVTAQGYDASDVGGYDLLKPLQNVKSVTAQGVNGPIYALLALDSAGYASDVRSDYVEAILAQQQADGSIPFSKEYPVDADTTAMAIQALAPYLGEQKVGIAVENALNYLSKLQQADGGYGSSEAVAQVILALNAVGVDLTNDAFVKNDITLTDNLMTYQLQSGAFCHTKGGAADGYASEQALRALVAVYNSIHSGVTFYGIR